MKGQNHPDFFFTAYSCICIAGAAHEQVTLWIQSGFKRVSAAVLAAGGKHTFWDKRFAELLTAVGGYCNQKRCSGAMFDHICIWQNFFLLHDEQHWGCFYIKDSNFTFLLFHNIVWEVNNIALNFSSAHVSMQISIQQPTETGCGDSDCAVGTSKQVTVENQALCEHRFGSGGLWLCRCADCPDACRASLSCFAVTILTLSK